jgi:hypothetical protein
VKCNYHPSLLIEVVEVTCYKYVFDAVMFATPPHAPQMFSFASLSSRSIWNSLINQSSTTSLRRLSSMTSTTSTPYKIDISPDNTGLLGLKQTDEASKKVSELLQKDLEVRFTPADSRCVC